MGRKRLSHGVGRHLWLKAKAKCANCGCRTYLPRVDEEHRLTNAGPRLATLDHIIPASKGGRNAAWNLQILCWECNHLKADSMPKEKRNVAED